MGLPSFGPAFNTVFPVTELSFLSPILCKNPTSNQPTMEDERLSIYKASRRIKRRDNSLYNALRSIYEDSIFIEEISQLWPDLPLLANLRCGLWYSPKFHSTCYFKSTDGHTNNLSFNTSRLNLHVALLAGIRARATPPPPAPFCFCFCKDQIYENN